MEKKILVTAAGDNQGKILVPKAAKAGFTVRAMRRSKGADELLAIGASNVVIGDASNPNDVAKVMEGVSTICHVGPTAHPDEKAILLLRVDAPRVVLQLPSNLPPLGGIISKERSTQRVRSRPCVALRFRAPIPRTLRYAERLSNDGTGTATPR
jgi:D-arabinose 1-dehydrogenase-like Zn-dependent alcohol dehydrogenase